MNRKEKLGTAAGNLKKGWISKDNYFEGLALAQLAPGPLAARLAIYLVYVRASILRAMVVGIAFVPPSFLMGLAISTAYVQFAGLAWMQAVLHGAGAAAIGIIARSAYKLVKTSLKNDLLLWVIFAIFVISTAVAKTRNHLVFLGGGIVTLAVKALPAKMVESRAGLIPLLVTTPFAGSRTFGMFLFSAKAGLFVFGSGLAIAAVALLSEASRNAA